MADTIAMSKERKVFVGYICSTCCTPVSTSVVIRTKIWHKNSLFATIPPSDHAENEIDQLVEKINSCAINKEAIGMLAKPPKRNSEWSEDFHKIDKYTDGFTWILDTRCRCPFCGNIEPWVADSIPSELQEKLKEDNFPHAYNDVARAMLWARLKLQDQEENLEKQRKLAGVIDKARAAYFKNAPILETLRKEMMQSDRIQAVHNLLKEVRQLTVDRLNCNRLEITKAFKLEKQIEENNKQIQSLMDEIITTSPAVEKTELECEVETDAILAFGLDGTAKMVVSCKSQGFRPQAAKAQHS